MMARLTSIVPKNLWRAIMLEAFGVNRTKGPTTGVGKLFVEGSRLIGVHGACRAGRYFVR